jgi:hypothetical protein
MCNRMSVAGRSREFAGRFEPNGGAGAKFDAGVEECQGNPQLECIETIVHCRREGSSASARTSG